MSYARGGLLTRAVVAANVLGGTLTGLATQGAAHADAATSPWPAVSSFVKVKHPVTVTLKLSRHGTTAFSIAGRGGVPSYSIAGVALHLTTSHATGSGSVVFYRSDSKRPTVESVTFAKGVTRSADVVVAPGADLDAHVAELGGAAVTVTARIVGFYRS